MSSNFTGKLYKYTDIQGAYKVLMGRSLKVSRAAEFNDPMDLFIEEALGADAEDFSQGLHNELLNFITSDVQINHQWSEPKAFIIALKNLYAVLPAEDKTEFMKVVRHHLEGNLFDIERLKVSTDITLNSFKAKLVNDGIFCASLSYSNLLLWSHYADMHRGVVLEFTPNVPKDSIFLTCKPVTYSNTRPLIYRTPADFIRRVFTMTGEEIALEVLESLVYTKALDWSYEEECRLYIPDFIPRDKQYELLRFWPDELTAIYFGCKILDHDRNQLLSIATKSNHSINIFQSRLHNREYFLVFERLI